MDISPIRNDADHEQALRTIERLWEAPAGSKEADAVEVLAILVEAYESDRWPAEASDPIDLLHYLISDDVGHTQSELAEILGSKSRASEILNRKRALTVEMIDKISKAWNISASLLAVPYALVDEATKVKSKWRGTRKTVRRKTVLKRRKAA